jgi:hypothetical protein
MLDAAIMWVGWLYGDTRIEFAVPGRLCIWKERMLPLITVPLPMFLPKN